MKFAVTGMFSRSAVAVVAALAFWPSGSLAAVIPAPAAIIHRAGAPVIERQLRPSAVSAPRANWKPHRLGAHVFYGAIVGLSGSIITLHLRNGHILDIDATAAIANGDYSAPLFVGKLVSIDGDEAGGTFTAEHIFRLTNLGSLRGDQ